MTHEQLIEAEKCLPLLKKCREHLDTAMHRMGEIPDSDFARLRRMYDHICSALDEA